MFEIGVESRFQFVDNQTWMFGRSPHLLRLGVSLAVSACSGGSDARKDAPDVAFDRNMLLAHLANNVLLPLQADVDAKAGALPGALDTYCDALDGGVGGTIATARTAAMTAWTDA